MTLARSLVGEALGTMLLVATVVGSGVMGENLASGNDALALLANAIATGAMLAVLILMFGSVSGAHFNPAVTLAFLMRGEISASYTCYYIAVQVVFGILGTLLAHQMFNLELIQIGTHARTGAGQWMAEAVATFALVFTILTCLKYRPEAIPFAVGLVIIGGYWYTASTSFANPAVTIARMFTNTFASIRPEDVLPFVIIQMIIATLTVIFARWILHDNEH